MTHLELTFLAHLKALRLHKRFVQEYKFHPDRKWKFDFADVENRVAVELEGGAWINGRHTRGSGFTKDCEKYNEAAAMGWKVLRYPSIKAMADFKRHYDLTKAGL